MRTAWEVALDRLLYDEGGIADLGDGKGITRYGQTDEWLYHHNLRPPTTQPEARANYDTVFRYYGIDKILPDADKALYFPLFYVLFTVMTHCGERRGILFLQRAANNMELHSPAERLIEDGIVGPKTRRFLHPIVTSPVTARQLCALVIAEYTRYLGVLLGATNIDRRKWAKGWLNRVARLMESA